MTTGNARFTAHIAVVLLAFTALIADLSHLSAELIIVGRTAFAAPTLFLFINPREFWSKLSAATLLRIQMLFLSGLLLCAHWLCFFKSITQGSVAIGLLTLACTPVFLILLNLLTGKQKKWRQDLATCVIIGVGVAIMVPKNLSADIMPWILGLLSALLIAIFAYFNKILVTEFSPIEISMVQTGLCVPLLLLIVPLQDIVGMSTHQWLYLAGCGVICTAMGQTLLLKSMQKLSSLSTVFIVNLEPVYGILLAIVILGDSIPLNQWIGGGVVVLGVLFSGLNFPSRPLLFFKWKIVKE